MIFTFSISMNSSARIIVSIYFIFFFYKLESVSNENLLTKKYKIKFGNDGCIRIVDGTKM